MKGYWGYAKFLRKKPVKIDFLDIESIENMSRNFFDFFSSVAKTKKNVFSFFRVSGDVYNVFIKREKNFKVGGGDFLPPNFFAFFFAF